MGPNNSSGFIKKRMPPALIPAAAGAPETAPGGFNSMKCLWVSCLAIAAYLLPLPILAQGEAAPSSCPVSFVKFDPGGFNSVNIRVKNVTGKKIVGLDFNAALADSTEHWQWLSLMPFVGMQVNFLNGAPVLPLREFGWNKEIKPGAAKTASWYGWNLNFEHGGGVAFVLTSVLFEDGSRWEDPPDRTTCMALWYSNHKKGIASQVVLPQRPLPGAHPLQY
jgi:hypothetical protein